MLETILTFHITLLGLGYWITRFLRLQKIEANGIAYFTSIPLLVCALYVLNAGLFIGLVVSSRLILGVALLGLVFLFMDKREIKSLLVHPVFYLAPLAGLFFALNPDIIYRPTEWDEYSQWLHRPMEMILDDSLLNPDRHGFLSRGGYDYNPGTSILLAYKNSVFGQDFSISQAIVIPLILCLSLLGLAFDCIKQLIPKNFVIPEITFLAGLVTLMFGQLIAINLLNESFLFNILIAIGLCFYWLSNGEVNRRSGLAILGIFCAYAYLVKSATVVFFPGLVVALILHQLSVWHDAKIEPFKALMKRLSIEILILVGPFVVIATHFILLTAPYEKQIQLWTITSLSTWEARAYLMPRIWEAVSHLVLLTPQTTFIMFAPLAGYLWGVIKDKTQRFLTLFVFSYCILTFFLIVWLMRTMFGSTEADGLASFGRYFSTIEIPYVFFGFLFLGINFFAFIRKLSSRWNLHRFIVYGYMGVLVASGLAIAYPEMIALGKRYTQIQTIPFDPIPEKMNALLKYINENNLNSLVVHVIDQGSDTTKITRINFYRLRKDIFQRGISFAGGRTMSTKSTSVWDEVGSRESIKKRLIKSDVIWIEKSDAFINDILSEVTNSSTCPWPLDRYFLFKGHDGRFECKALQNPTFANCDSLMQAGEKKSGVYEMDPDGFGPLPRIKTRCEMKADGAWTLVASINEKNREHANSDAVNKDNFFMDGKFGKLSDSLIGKLAVFQEFRLQCGTGNISEVFIKDHTWRSNENGYRGLFSIDQKQWTPFQERGSPGWNGFDNYAAAYSAGGNPKSFMGYSIETTGCYSSSNGDKAASGYLWVR